MSRVLVTGGAGFVGSHALVQLLDAGHEVRATVRDLARAGALRSLVVGDGRPTDRLEIVAADLIRDEGWADAVAGCDFVLHVASPFPATQPKDEDALLVPARDGTLRVLRAARDAGVRRVVVTSSFAAIGYGHPPRDDAFTEDDWTDPRAADVQPYMRSKVAAERAAWDFIGREGGDLELAVVNPVGIFGPALGPDVSGSLGLLRAMLDGAMPACPRVYFGVVDVRDVVDLHLRAMTSPAARGQRYLAVAGEPISMLDAAQILRDRLGDGARRAPTRQLPDWLVRGLAWVRPQLREVVPQLGKRRRASSAKAREELGWSPRSTEDAIAAAGESLVRLGR
ncbi:MAG: aldehyde reductase [Nannocystaceae bacterium]